jgi:C-terminal processing protease CtpA/Prc
MHHRLLAVTAVVWIAASLVLAGQAAMSKADRDLYKQMLVDLRKDVEANYYDRAFRGVDLATIFKDASEKVAAATTATDAMDALTNTLFQFGDSHTRFYPPARVTQADYGWVMTAVGDEVLVTRVKPSSDAARRGLAPGDRVLALNRCVPTRANLWQIQHYYGVVRPQVQQHVVVRKPDGSERTFDIQSKIERRQVIQITDAVDDAIEDFIADFDTDFQLDPGIRVWRMTSFRDPEFISPFIGRARSATALVLDLRDNGGGVIDGLKALVGWLFDRQVSLMTMVGRKGERPEVVKPKGGPFLGRLVVLINSRSASASELLARTVQLQKRGTVIGDRSAGAVMTARIFSHEFGIGNVTFYGTSVTVSDIVMPDGGRLEGAGVTPDELLLPTPGDLAAGRDPVLARAVALAGGSLTAEQAGVLYSKK